MMLSLLLLFVGVAKTHGSTKNPILSKSPPCPGTTEVSAMTAGFNLTHQVVVVTGGASGLGYAVSDAFASRGATVIIADWNPTKGKAAAKSIAGDVRYVFIDLSSLAAVRAFVPALTAEVGHGNVSILFNNAAGPGDTNTSTPDGFNEKFEIDYLGPFLLTELLLPGLRAAAKTHGRPSRVVNIASDVHIHACELAGWPRDCFKDFTHLPLPAQPPRTVTVHYGGNVTMQESSSYYGACKFLQIQHAAELAVREKGLVEAASVHPGSCLASWHPPPSTWDEICNVTYPQHPVCPYSVQQGTAVYAFASLHPIVSGTYYSRVLGCEAAQPTMHGFKPEMRKELYTKSQAWVGLGDGTVVDSS